MKPYNHLVGYLHRWVVLKLGRLMIRVHHILKPDGTPYFHNHPFCYLSIILSGGYEEQVLEPNGDFRTLYHTKGHFILRGSDTFHRISRVQPETKTLFICFDARRSWVLKRHKGVEPPESYDDLPSGVYRMANGAYRKRSKGVWYVKTLDPESAASQNRISIHQTGKEVKATQLLWSIKDESKDPQAW